MSDTRSLLTINPAGADVEMGTITSHQTVNGRGYHVRCRKPDRSEAEKRRATTMSEAKPYLSMVRLSKSEREYIDPSASRVLADN